MSDYRGLVNEGSTCYLNSLLQTLFMTPEFRRNVYKYVHDEKRIKATDSIPYQLQKIFVKLQLNKESVYTKGLLRSFQWNEHDSFTQHDVQEFCRILFEAIQKSQKGDNWIEKLYSGSMESFISCEKHTRSTPELFMDLSLPIFNPFTRKYSQSVEECLKDYLKPELLDDKINCDECGEKVSVTKGVKFSSLPEILTLQLNRFQLNYDTFQRQKVNSFLYFPEILEMDRFLRPYSEIQIKGIPQDLKEKTVIKEKEKSSRTTDYWGGGNLIVSGQAIKKRKNSDQIQTKKQKIQFFDEENKDKRQEITRELTDEEEKMKNLQILKELKADKQKLDRTVKKETKPPVANVAPPAASLQDDMLFGSFMSDVDLNFSSGTFDRSESLATKGTTNGPTFEKTVATFDHNQEGFDPSKQYPENTYVLYSILVHSGGAYGGHYYAYIFDGQSWHCFNDNKVYKVDKSQIRKYGNPTESANYGANAYLLFYRKANSFTKSLQPIEIPEALLEKVTNDVTVEPVSETKKYNRLDEVNNSLIVKAFMNAKTQETFVVNKLQETIGSLREKIKGLFGIQQEDHNWRLRRYNKIEDSMHEIYGEGVYSTSLHDLGMRETSYFIVEKKKEMEQFMDYDPKNIIIKVNVWREGLTILTEQYLRPIKIGIREQVTFAEFYQKLKKVSGLDNPLVIKRNFSVGNPYVVYDLADNADKTLISLRFFNGINLYVEADGDRQQLKWNKEFQDQKYRCCIKFNDPQFGDQKNLEIFIDNRKTLGELKEKISSLISLPVEEFRMKKSQNSVSEMTTYRKKLIDLRIINNQFLHLEIGKSSKGTIIVRRGVAAIIDDQIDFSLGEQTQVDIQGSFSTVADLKNVISQKYGIDCFNIRIREYRAHQFSEIFPDTEILQKIREKSLVWQETEIEDPRGMQVYVRVFDAINMEFKPLQSIFVEMSANYEEFTYILEEETGIQADKILVWKSLSHYIEKSMLFECEWVETKFIQSPIREEPLFITNDGEIIIVKEASEAYHPKPNKKYQSAAEYEVAAGGKRKGETALKITVVEEMDSLEDQDQPAAQTTTIPQSASDSQQKPPAPPTEDPTSSS